MSNGTAVDLSLAREWRFAQKLVGADSAPLAGDCSNPVTRSMRGAADPVLVAVGRQKESIQIVDIDVRCRKCPNCRQAHRRHWAMRAQSEIAASNRTWFGTLTLAPEKQFHLVALASSRLKLGGTIYSDLPPDQQFRERCKPLVEEFQRFMKRLRKKQSGVRHLAIIERHKSGAPHMHLLLHERAGPLRHRFLQDKWCWGFSQFNLVAEGNNPKEANYVTKYLTKSLTLRVVSSQGYGKT